METSNSNRVPLKACETVDAFMDGRLRLIQSCKGYRFSVDSILLSQFVTTRRGNWVVDLGGGCGIIGLMLLLTRPINRVICLEIQPTLADQALRNAALNGFEEKMNVILGDIKHPPLPASIADVVVCNPPYRPARSGRINPHQERAIARHEILTSLNDILTTAVKIMKPGGCIAMAYPAVRLADLVVRLRSFGLEPKRMRVLYPGLEKEAKLIFLEAILGGRAGLKILPPLMNQGDFSISIST
ncbi:MAG: methyltransferase [Deltaproteobacteria bacterium]|nr:methyltransferase [Deltaproteobacteria bacterium]